MLGTHPALTRVEPDIVVDRIWVSGQASENDLIFMSSHWIGKCSHFSDMIIRQRDKLLNLGDHILIVKSSLNRFSSLFGLLIFLCDVL